MGGSTGQGELDSAGVKVGALRGFSEEVTMGLSMKDGDHGVVHEGWTGQAGKWGGCRERDASRSREVRRSTAVFGGTGRG